MKHTILFTIFLVLLSFTGWSQTGLRGSINDGKGERLPFATIYIKGTTNGTTANEEGDYFLKVPAGTHTIVVQHVGYRITERQVTIADGQVVDMDFVLGELALQLEVVTITAGEDPAYRVIREAIKKRKFYEEEVRAFKTDAYLKGLQRLDKRPEKFLGIKITVDTGIVYLSESVSEFAFERPDKVSERMISSKVSGNEQGFSFNQASDFNINLYEKNFYLEGLSERAFISPIARQAFLFYDYELLGVFQENGQLINKIRLLPRRSSDPVFEGIIYIVEDTWKFHTVDLMLTKQRGIDFADSLRINQVFAPVEHDIWMPISQRFSFKFKLFGFVGSGYFIGVYSNYEVEPNYDLYQKEGLFESTFERNEQTDLFEKADFTPEVLFVEEGSNERDSAYWEQIRPMPLTGVEVEDYRVKDSIRLVKESMPYKDSVDRERNKLTVGNILLSGYTHFNSINEDYWSLPAITSLFQFNTVEGFVPEFQPTYWHQVDGRTKYWIRPSLRYGVSNKRFNMKIDASYRKLDRNFTRYYIGGGRYIAQFDERGAITPFINTYVTLVEGKNYMKLFEKSFGYFRYQRELMNGLLMNATVQYASRDTLTNTKTDYYWPPTREVKFTSNQPFNEELSGEGGGTGFARKQALTLSAGFRIRFGQRYATRPDRKFVYASKYPELFLTYKKAFEALGGDVNYDFVSLRVRDDVRLGLTGTSNYAVEVGGFLNSKRMTFVDFKHFSGNQTTLSPAGLAFKFELLPFYTFSTKDTYFEAHYEHHFNEFIFNKIPLIKKLNFQAVVAANYLTTRTIGHYMEFGAGVEHIFRFMRVDYWWAFRNGNFVNNGLRVGVGF